MISFSSSSDFSSSSSNDNNSEDDNNRNDNEDDDDHNNESNDDDDWGNEALVDEVDAFESFFLDGALAFSTSLVVSFIEFVAARAKELKKLNVNIIIQRVDADDEKNENKNNNERN